MEPMDIAACPGSGKTVLLVAKLAILAEKWRYRTRGICVLSHTNAARHQIETRLGKSTVGRRLLCYPHFIGTIHGFVNDFLALPWLRSQGYPMKMIDTELCERRRWSKLQPKSKYALECKHVGESDIRILDTSFTLAKKTGKFPFADRTSTYRDVKRACEETAREGYHCYDDMFIWGHDIMDRVPNLFAVIRDRFPLLFVDEAQDNSQDQSAILHRIFMDGGTRVIRQRFGDGNQAIFDFLGAKEATTDRFPIDAMTKDLPNSHRFGERIAHLADPLGIAPYGLKGHGPKKPLASGQSEGRHTIFLFDDDGVDKVLQLYAELLLATFSEQELREGTFTAVGQVHKDKKNDDRPRHVGHYWPDYDPDLGRPDPKPKTFVQYVLAGQGRARASAEIHPAVEKIAEGILRLCDLVEEGATSPRRRHGHRHILERLQEQRDIRERYQDLMMHFAVEREALAKETWERRWRDVVRKIGETIAAASALRLSREADRFLVWPEESPNPLAYHSTRKNRDNIYGYPTADPDVNIRVGSIHSVKGETHTATLALETFWYDHNLASIMDWLCGDREGGSGQNQRIQNRLKVHYVAMTRPTHLLCLAMRLSTFQNSDGELDQDLIHKLKHHGWQVRAI